MLESLGNSAEIVSKLLEVLGVHRPPFGVSSHPILGRLGHPATYR